MTFSALASGSPKHPEMALFSAETIHVDMPPFLNKAVNLRELFVFKFYYLNDVDRISLSARPGVWISL